MSETTVDADPLRMKFTADPLRIKFTTCLTHGNLRGVEETLAAAAAESPETARCLLNGIGYLLPPLVLAAAGCPLPVVELLIGRGATLDRAASCEGVDEIPQGSTALHVAAAQDRIHVVEALLSAGARPNVSDARGWTPLMMSTRSEEKDNQAAIAKALLLHGADPTAEDYSGALALHPAAGKGSVEVIDLLVEELPSSLNRTTANGATALFLAATTPGLDHVVSHLLFLGATNRAVLGNGSCPLTGAVHYSLHTMARLVVEEGWDAVGGGGGALPRAMHLAAIKNLPRTFWLLLNAEGARGPREEEEDRRRCWARCLFEGRPVLYTAIAADNARVVSMLLACGANDGNAAKIFNLYNNYPGKTSPMDRRRRRDPESQAAVRRTIARAAAYRARPWAWPVLPPPGRVDAVAADAAGPVVVDPGAVGVGGGAGDVVSFAGRKRRGRTLGVRVCRPRSRAWLVNLIGRHSRKR